MVLRVLMHYIEKMSQNNVHGSYVIMQYRELSPVLANVRVERHRSHTISLLDAGNSRNVRASCRLTSSRTISGSGWRKAASQSRYLSRLMHSTFRMLILSIMVSSQGDCKLACLCSISLWMYVFSSVSPAVRRVSINLRLTNHTCTPRAASVPTDLHNETGAILTGAPFLHPRTYMHPRGAPIPAFAVNIHSHLGGAALFAALLFTFPSVYFVHYETTTWADFAVFAIFLSAAVFCLFSSAFYHTFSAHSPGVRTHLRSRGTRVMS